MKDGTISFDQALREPKIISMINKNEMITSRYFANNVQKLIEVLMSSDEFELRRQAYQIINSSNSIIISSASCCPILKTISSSLLSSINPNEGELERFAYITFICLRDFPDSIKTTLSYLPDFLPFVYNYNVLNLFTELLGNSDITNLHSWLSDHIHLSKQCTDLIEDYRLSTSEVEHRDEVIEGLYRILISCSKNSIISHSLHNPLILKTICSSFKTIKILNSQWELIFLISSPPVISSLLDCIPDSFENVISLKGQEIIHPYQVYSLNFISQIIEYEPDHLVCNDLAKFSKQLSILYQQFPNHSILLSAINEVIFQGLIQSKLRNFFTDSCLPMLTQILKDGSKNIVQFGYAVNLAQRIMKKCDDDDDASLLADIEAHDEFVDECNSVVISHYSLIHHSYGCMSGSVHIPSNSPNLSLSHIPVFLTS